jgi:hypothetical protein
MRRPGQDSDKAPSPANLLSSALQVIDSLPEMSIPEEASAELRTPEEIQASKDLGDFNG